ncbi:MAG: hypothetical protein RLZZ230_369 [Candidatus Parcubacteria bacterium]|jgi:hypothetical protein
MVIQMKKTTLVLAIALALSSASVLATGYSGADVSVSSGSFETSAATGMYTYAENAGSSDGSAILFNGGAVAMGDYATQHSGQAMGYGSSATAGQGGGGVDLSIHHNNVAADSGTGQSQQAVNGGGYYGYYGYYGSNTMAQGSGNSNVAGATWNADFSAHGSDSQLASGGFFYGAPSATTGGETAFGSITGSSSFGGFPH